MLDPKQAPSNTLGENPASLHQAPDKLTGTTKRRHGPNSSHIHPAGSSANKPETTASNKLRKIVDIKPTIPQGMYALKTMSGLKCFFS
jgi:hypothetical protein